MERVSASEREFRLAHLKDVMYFATQYEWQNVLTFHSACLFEIEYGRRRWGDAFLDLVPTTLAGAILRKKDARYTSNYSQASSNSMNNYNDSHSTSNSNLNSSRSNYNTNNNNNNSNSNNNNNSNNDILWCKGYQTGVCTFKQDHSGVLNGKARFLRHICAKCWGSAKIYAVHPDTSSSCPSRTET